LIITWLQDQAPHCARVGYDSALSIVEMTDKITGELDALTVEQVGNPSDRPTWVQVLLAYLDPSKEVIPMDVAYPPGVPTKQVFAEDAQMMLASQQDAQAAALTFLGLDYRSRVYVDSMMSDSAAKGLIAPGDFIDSLDGVPMSNTDTLRAQIQTWDGVTPLKIGITHKGTSKVVEVSPKKVSGRFYVGVYVGYKYVFPFKIDVSLGDVGGPSAGTMFAIGIIDKLTPGALLGKNHAAGTGTIEPNGSVGPIGGIVQKMYAAKAAGATVFLAPSDNCAETVGKTPSGLRVFKIKQLKQAVEILTAMQSGSSLSGFATCSK
jgi:PDZ domain-containing protein